VHRCRTGTEPVAGEPRFNSVSLVRHISWSFNRKDRGFNEHRAAGLRLLPFEAANRHCNPEESGEANGLVGAGGLEMTAESLGAHVDAEDELRVRETYRSPRIESIELGQQTLLDISFLSAQPHCVAVEWFDVR
jgi:hypothetical protein